MLSNDSPSRPAATAAPVSAREPRTPLSVAFVLAPRFTLLAFSAFVDTLRLAADDGDRSRPLRCRWRVVGDNLRPIRASCGVEVVPTAEPDEPRAHDYIVVVGGLLDAPALSLPLQRYLRRAAAQQVALVGVCTGSFILAQLGLMHGRRCCVSWFHHAAFVQRHPQIACDAGVLYVIDRDRLTCAGGTSVVHLASHLVAQHCGHGSAAKALRIMIEDTKLPENAPQPQPASVPGTDEARVRKAMLLMERNLERPLPAGFVARQVGLGSRQLERLFRRELGTTPSAFAMQLRLQRARELLQHGQAPIYDIALQCGFVNDSHFARRFRAVFGMAPSAARAQAARWRQQALPAAPNAPEEPPAMPYA